MFAADQTLHVFDPELAAMMDAEYRRQEAHVELIASENYVSPAVMEAQGSVLTNKYAEGYPGKRYYGGCEFADVVEQLAIDTKIPRASIDALEEDRFTALPGPVFVKGFFRCCARSLSLDAEVVMALLHEHERAQQQLKSGRRERHSPQLARPAAVATGSAVGSLPRGAGTASPAAMQPMHALAAGAATGATGEAALVHGGPGPAPLFDISTALRGLVHALVRGMGPALARLRGATSFAANSRLLMWIAVTLMVALIVVTAFVMAGGGGPGLPQS